jgi:site-specific recombinase XerD
VDEEVITRNPALRIKKPVGAKRIVRTLSMAHIDALFSSCDRSTPEGFRDFTLMLVLLDTGVRVSELCGMRLDSVREDHIKVFGKGAKEREVGTMASTTKYLWKYVN